MKQAIITLTILLLTNIVQAQNRVRNGGFEENSSGCKNPPDNPAMGFDLSPFNDGKVSHWQASHGTPQITKTGCNSTNLDNEVFKGKVSAYMYAGPLGLEGIFQQLNHNKDESFNLIITARSHSSNAVLHVELTKGLSNAPNTQITLSLPSVSARQVVFNSNLNTTWQTFMVDGFIADDDYTQIWIYATGDAILVDEVTLYKSCCEPFKLWQNVTDPPNTYVNNYIKAGNNVDPSVPQGDVLVTGISGPLLFQAGQTISLEPGFVTAPDADFTAEIKPCSETPLQVFIEEIDLLNNTTGKPDRCFTQFKATACYGSGDYTYTWLNGDGHPILENYSDQLTTSSSRMVSVSVTDNITSETAFKEIHLVGDFFHGDFSASFTNLLFGIDGSGPTDPWEVIDEDRIGQSTFGYNAYKYELFVYDRWGIELHTDDGMNAAVGFPYNHIRWDVNACADVGSGTYFFITKLGNCSKDQTFETFATLFCTTSEAFPMNIDSLYAMPDLWIYPNPVQDRATIIFQYKGLFSLKITNNSGQTIKESAGKSPAEVDLSEFAPGIYHIVIETEEGEISKKTLILQD